MVREGERRWEKVGDGDRWWEMVGDGGRWWEMELTCTKSWSRWESSVWRERSIAMRL